MVEIVVHIYMLDKATANIALVCEKIYAPVVAKELGLNNNSSTDTFNGINNVSANDIIDNDIKDLNIKFDIDNIPIENGGLPDIY